MKDLKKIRLEMKLTQKQAAELVGISLRSYKTYENDIQKSNTLKYNYLVDKLEKFNPIDENHGILDLKDIRQKCAQVFDNYEVDLFLYGHHGALFPASDVDLLISSNVKGLKFYELVEEIRNILRKKVDVLDMNQLKDNWDLTKEILKEGIKIYG